MHADFVAYDVDPIAAESVEGLRPVLTVSLGREVSRVNDSRHVARDVTCTSSFVTLCRPAY